MAAQLLRIRASSVSGEANKELLDQASKLEELATVLDNMAQQGYTLQKSDYRPFVTFDNNREIWYKQLLGQTHYPTNPADGGTLVAHNVNIEGMG